MQQFPIHDLVADAHHWRCRVKVPPDSGYFQGHFPGRPVLSAMAQIALIVQIYRMGARCGASPHAVPFLRLRRTILPGEELSIRLDRPNEDAQSSFEIRRSGDLASNGVIRWRTEGTDAGV